MTAGLCSLSIANEFQHPACLAEERDFFADELWGKVVERTCLKCHKSGGDAEDSEFILLDPSLDGALQQNRERLMKLTKQREPKTGKSRILLKVIGELDHGGEDVLAKGSTRYRILEDFVRRTNGEGPARVALANAKPFFEAVRMIDHRKLLRRLTLQLGARLPTPKEHLAVQEHGLPAISSILDDLMNEEAFYDRLAEGFNDLFLTPGIDDVAENVLSYEHFEKTRHWYQKKDFSHLKFHPIKMLYSVRRCGSHQVMGKTYNVGVVGYGWAATAHIEAINKTAQGRVTAVCSSRDLEPASLAEAHGSEIKVYRKLEDLLGDDSIDVVDITSFPAQHKEQAIAAAEAGKQVILEKPITLNLEDAEAVREAFEKNGTKSCVCFELRFISQFTTTRALLDQRMIGRVHYGEIDYFHGIGPWYGQYRWNITRANGGSSLLSAGCHALDALLLCMGSEVEEVVAYHAQSTNENFAHYQYPTTTVMMLKFKNGAVGKCSSVIDCQQPYYFHTHLCGSEGSILDNKIYSSKLHLRDKAWTELPVALVDSGDVADHPYQDQFQAFFDALDRQESMPLTSYEEAFQTFRVVFAADQSGAEGRPIKL